MCKYLHIRRKLIQHLGIPPPYASYGGANKKGRSKERPFGGGLGDDRSFLWSRHHRCGLIRVAALGSRGTHGSYYVVISRSTLDCRINIARTGLRT